MKKDLLKAWILAARPRTLPLSLAGMLMGSFLALAQNKFNIWVFVFAAVTSLLLQILSNMANDYGDSVWGADNIHREGPDRAVQSGLINATLMKKGIKIIVFVTFISGILLLLSAAGFSLKSTFFKQGFIFFLIAGILAIFAAILYTNGKKPYGYIGMGDIFVFLFFGIVSVMGTFYLHTLIFDWKCLLPASSCGLFSVAVLNLNNIRDIKSDVHAGKKSIPVRIGRKKATYYHAVLLFAGFFTAVIYLIISFRSYRQFIFILTIPLFVSNAIAVNRYEEAMRLDPYLRQLALSTLLFVICFGIGILL